MFNFICNNVVRLPLFNVFRIVLSASYPFISPVWVSPAGGTAEICAAGRAIFAFATTNFSLEGEKLSAAKKTFPLYRWAINPAAPLVSKFSFSLWHVYRRLVNQQVMLSVSRSRLGRCPAFDNRASPNKRGSKQHPF